MTIVHLLILTNIAYIYIICLNEWMNENNVLSSEIKYNSENTISTQMRDDIAVDTYVESTFRLNLGKLGKHMSLSIQVWYTK